jgi:hypothetical protein
MSTMSIFNTGIQFFTVDGGMIGFHWAARGQERTISIVGNPTEESPSLALVDTIGDKADVLVIARMAQIPEMLSQFRATGQREFQPRKCTPEEIETARKVYRAANQR